MKRKLRVLTVEDSEDDARLLIRELKLGGYDVTYRRVETGVQLRAALASDTWDVILCDYAFPQFSGDEALRIVRETLLDVPFIFVSGKIGEETAVQAMKAGAHDYVMKNNLARLAAAVDRELGEAQIRAESRQAEEMMRVSEHKYRHLFESMSDAAFLVAEDSGKVIDVNPQAERLLARSRTEIIDLNQRDFYTPKSEQLVFPKPLGEPEDHENYEAEVTRKDGSVIPADVRVSRIHLQGHNLLLLLLRDITRRRQTEVELRNSREQLRALAARLQEVREEERTRVAREIHDELGQMLTGLKMDLRWIEHDLEGFGDQRLNPVLEKAVSATELTDMLAKSVQRIAAELRPGILDRLGLVMALSYEADQFHQRTGLACQIRVPEEEITLPNESVTAVFRIFQEAMTNIARHAEASEVNIDFRLESDSLVLEVRDNGKGIKPGDLVGDRSLGVLGMKERARQMDADISFKPSPNGGTVVTLRIPYHHSRIEAHQPSAALCSK